LTSRAVFKRPVLPLTGGCACGSIRYEITAMPLLLCACHCMDCQCRSGSSFSRNMPVATKALRIVKGAPKGWRSGATTTSWFCGDCGCRIYGERDERPDAMTVRAGTLDDTTWLRPAAHIFTRSAQPWENLAGDTASFETTPGDFAEAAHALRALWLVD
jgi:hypothetical protein